MATFLPTKLNSHKTRKVYFFFFLLFFSNNIDIFMYWIFVLMKFLQLLIIKRELISFFSSLLKSCPKVSKRIYKYSTVRYEFSHMSHLVEICKETQTKWYIPLEFIFLICTFLEIKILISMQFLLLYQYFSSKHLINFVNILYQSRCFVSNAPFVHLA